MGSVFAPVWLRLNHNRIRDPEHVRKTAEAEGITICTAWDRQACGTSKCCRRECPLVHLYSFNVQAKRRDAASQREQHPPHPPDGDDASQDRGDLDATGDPRSQRRKRNRKPGSKDPHAKKEG